MKNVLDIAGLALIVTVLSALIQLSAADTALTQDSGEAPAPAPEVMESGPNFPDYIVKPREETNPYDLSTISPDTDIEYRDGVGTLGTTTEQKSNIEINEMLQKNKADRDKARLEAQKKEAEKAKAEAAQPEAAVSAEPEPQASSKKPGSISPGVKGGLFRWVDSEGVLHVTNDLGQVPIEYQIQALERSGDISVEHGDTKN